MRTAGRLACWSRRANGPLMARQSLRQQHQTRIQAGIMALTWAFLVERVTGIEPALSAWEAKRLRLLRALTCQFQWPAVAVTAPSSPWLMAR